MSVRLSGNALSGVKPVVQGLHCQRQHFGNLCGNIPTLSRFCHTRNRCPNVIKKQGLLVHHCLNFAKRALCLLESNDATSVSLGAHNRALQRTKFNHSIAHTPVDRFGCEGCTCCLKGTNGTFRCLRITRRCRNQCPENSAITIRDLGEHGGLQKTELRRLPLAARAVTAKPVRSFQLGPAVPNGSRCVAIGNGELLSRKDVLNRQHILNRETVTPPVHELAIGLAGVVYKRTLQEDPFPH
mmetsp:Transcript_32390/g.86912  ORF Transcript_32390/g.86912 Transcript_32390/m.86912 type:complete len:241 (-) Transcript_32390:616-1338(-)